MPFEQLLPLCAAILLVAFLYSSVGHAGASGYIAVMTLFGLTQTTIKPAALLLNILVASLTAWQFWRAGYFSWEMFWPFALAALPLAFVGGALNLPTRSFKALLGLVLIFSALRFLWPLANAAREHNAPPPKSVALSLGAALGLLAGVTGTGGGIFLTPLLLLKGWATTKTAAAVSALFILVNSVAGLLGNYSATRQLPWFALPLALAALAGGAAGSYLGSQRLSPVWIKRLLAVVLLIAGYKLMFT